MLEESENCARLVSIQIALSGQLYMKHHAKPGEATMDVPQPLLPMNLDSDGKTDFLKKESIKTV